MSTIHSPGARETYDAFAAHYEHFTADHDHDAWCAELLAAARRHGQAGTRLLDLGCGTGKSFAPLKARGFSVTAVDVSPAMLGEARRRHGDGIRYVCGDICADIDLGPHDLVTCLADCLNYVLDDAGLDAACRTIRRGLSPTGVAVFDVNTLGTYRRVFAATSVLERDGTRFVWRGEAAADVAPGALASATIEVRERDGRRHRVRHVQRHVPHEAVCAALTRAGLRIVECAGQGLDGILRPAVDEITHSKRVYIVMPNTQGEEVIHPC